MNRVFLVLVFGGIIGLFFFFSQAIVGIKLQELRFGILRDQLMNYELSSETLRERLKQMFLSREDYLQEVKVNILESGIMNAETKGLELELSPRDKVGLSVVNTVRLLNFKPALELEEQQKIILRLQFAFYMERTRKFSQAHKKYEELEALMQNSLSDERAFVSLHNGYCLVMMGEREKAYVKLNKTIDLFPGTHYADNAKLLINFLNDGEKRKEKLKSGSQDPESLAYSLFQSGDYEETLKTLEKLPVLTNDQSYIKARAMEELGKTSNAVKEYIQLVKQKDDKEVAIRANRRLLLIGNFYQESKSLVEYSKSEATKLGDTKAAEQIEEGKSLVQKPMIIEKLLKEEEKKGGSEEAKELQEIRESITASLQEVEQESQKTLSVVKEENIPLAKEDEVRLLPKQPVIEPEKEVALPVEEPKPEPPPVVKRVIPEVQPYLEVSLVDSRKFQADRIESLGNVARLRKGKIPMEIPWELVKEIEIGKGSGGAKFTMETKEGIKSQAKVLKRDGEGLWMVSGETRRFQDSEVKTIQLQQN